MEHSVLCLLTYTFISDLLSGLAKIVDCFHSCYPFEDKLSSSTLFSVCLARSGRPVEPCIQYSCAVGNSCGSEYISIVLKSLVVQELCRHAQRLIDSHSNRLIPCLGIRSNESYDIIRRKSLGIS